LRAWIGWSDSLSPHTHSSDRDPVLWIAHYHRGIRFVDEGTFDIDSIVPWLDRHCMTLSLKGPIRLISITME
jgi:hypothetical protein